LCGFCVHFHIRLSSFSASALDDDVAEPTSPCAHLEPFFVDLQGLFRYSGRNPIPTGIAKALHCPKNPYFCPKTDQDCDSGRSPLGMEGASIRGGWGLLGLPRHILSAAAAGGGHGGCLQAGAGPAPPERGGRVSRPRDSAAAGLSISALCATFIPCRGVPASGGHRRDEDKCGSRRPNAQSVICSDPVARPAHRLGTE
jgi:hypothetical protein